MIRKEMIIFYSKKSFYKDLNSLPSIGMGKTTINVPAVTSKVKSLTKEKDKEVYCSYLKFKAPKTGTYVCTLTNLQGVDDNAVRAMMNIYFDKIVKKWEKTMVLRVWIVMLLANTIVCGKTITWKNSVP